MSVVSDADIRLQYEVERLIFQEAYLLDNRMFDSWLDLYLEDAEYLMPAWINETELATDPNAELFLIYFPTKAGLDDRVLSLIHI